MAEYLHEEKGNLVTIDAIRHPKPNTWYYGVRCAARAASPYAKTCLQAKATISCLCRRHSVSSANAAR
jgi:hypothetical protein